MDYVAKADRQYTYENGRRMINLPEVQVRGMHQDKHKSPFDSWARIYFSAEDIERLGITSGISLVNRVPGTMTPKPHLANPLPTVQIDGKPLMTEDDVPFQEIINGNEREAKTQLFYAKLNMINMKNVKHVFADIGFISIYTKNAEDRGTLPSDNIKLVTPLGYQLPVEFYSPKYDTQESFNNPKPDLRTTIYWKPNVITDNEGNAQLFFYAADDPGTYSVIIEGVSEDGKLIHYRGGAAISVK